MKKISFSFVFLATAIMWAYSNVNLKTFYENKKAEIIPTFQAPELGSDVSITISSGQTRSGILMKLSAESLELMTDSRMVTYKRSSLKESSRAFFFAEDFAHVKALEMTRIIKEQAYRERIEENASNTHDGSITVSANTQKTNSKEKEEENRDNERTGNTVTITTITRTYSEVQNLQITIANTTTHPDTYTINWYFFGQMIGSKAVSVHDKGTKKVTVQERGRVVEKVASKSFDVIKSSRTTSSVNSSYSRDPKISESGTDSAGWLVILKYGNDLLDMKASSKTYLNDEWLSKVQ